MSEKRAALSAVRNGQNPQVKQAKTQADIAKKKYETFSKEVGITSLLLFG